MSHLSNTKSRQAIPFSLAIPASFTSGTQSGQLTSLDGYTVRVALSPNMTLPQDSEAHLIQAAIPYTQPNIGLAADAIPGFTAGNDRISINWNAGGRTDYIFPTGLYGVADLALALNQIAATAGWISAAATSPLFILTGITATQKILITVDPSVLAGGAFPAGGVVIDFLNPSVAALNNSIGPMMGWPTSGGGATLTIAGAGTAPVSFLAPNVANLAIFSAYALWASCVTDSYNQGLTGKLLAVFPLGAFSPNSIMSIQPALEYPVPVASGTYSTMDFYFTDQSMNRLLLSNFQAPVEFSFLIAPLPR